MTKNMKNQYLQMEINGTFNAPAGRKDIVNSEALHNNND